MKAPFDEMHSAAREVRDQYRVYERWLERSIGGMVLSAPK